MRGNQIVTSAVCVGIVLALAGLAPGKAAAQTNSSSYDDNWTKPFCSQSNWDEKAWEGRNMRWDLKMDEPADMMSKHGSVAWDTRWFKPFDTQPYWDESTWENRNMRWDLKVHGASDMSDAPESMTWDNNWDKPFFMQSPWDEQRWEDHCMNWKRPNEFRHKNMVGMGSLPE